MSGNEARYAVLRDHLPLSERSLWKGFSKIQQPQLTPSPRLAQQSKEEMVTL